MSKKLCLFLLSAGLFNTGIVQAQWSLEKSPTRNNLNSVSFISNTSGWIAGDKGTILYIKDSEWKEYQKPTYENLYSIYMLNESEGWAVGANGTIIRFDGKNWKPVVSPTKKNLLSVCFRDSENGIAAGESGTVVIYMNGIWNVSGILTRGDLFTTSVINDDVWVGGGLECVNVPIMKMVYKGNMNVTDNYDSYASINSIFFINSYNGWAVGSPATILHFDGLKWEKPLINDKFSSLNSIFFSDENNGISVGYSGTIMAFSDGRWIKENSYVTQNLKGAAIIGKTWYAIGDSGTIVMKDLSSNIITAAIPQRKSGLIQLFPNPCDQFVNVVLPPEINNSAGLISITNSNGQIILHKDFKLENGNSPYIIITKDLVNGLYILEATIGGKMITSKLIISH